MEANLRSLPTSPGVQAEGVVSLLLPENLVLAAPAPPAGPPSQPPSPPLPRGSPTRPGGRKHVPFSLVHVSKKPQTHSILTILWVSSVDEAGRG